MMPTVKSSKSGFTCRGHASCRARRARSIGLPPACCQRARARSPSAAAASPCTTICTSCMRHVRLARRIAAPRLGGVVGRDVPAAHGQVDAAAVRDVVIDDDELLVMRRADRQVAVEQDLDALRYARAEDQARKELAVHRVEDRVIPQQNLDLELRAALQQPASSLPSSTGAPSVGREWPSSRVRLCSSQPRMKIVRCAASSEARSASK